MQSWLLVLLSCLCATSAQNLREQVCSADTNVETFEYNSANVVIGVLSSVRNAGTRSPYGCGNYDTYRIQQLEATKFAVNYINRNNYVPNVKFGLKIHDACSQSINTLKALQDLYPTSTSYSGNCSAATQPKLNLGVISQTYNTQTFQSATLAGEIPTPFISTIARATSLNDKSKYPTFLRTSDTFTDRSRAAISVIKNLKWTDLLVIYTEDDFGTTGYKDFLEVAEANNVCVSRALRLPSSTDQAVLNPLLRAIGNNAYAGAYISAPDHVAEAILEAARNIPELGNIQWIVSDVELSSPTIRERGLIGFSNKAIQIPDFRSYFTLQENNLRISNANPWLKAWYEQTNGCSFAVGAPNACPNYNLQAARNSFFQHPATIPAIKAVFAYAEAVRQVCGFNGVCQTLQRMSPQDFYQTLMNVDFTFTNNLLSMGGETIKFDSQGNLEKVTYDVYNLNFNNGVNYKLNKVGSIENEILTWSSFPSFYDARGLLLLPSPTSECPADGCPFCLAPSRSVSFTYQGGDFVLASLVNAHKDGERPLSCNEGSSNKLMSLLALEYAAKNYHSVHNGLKGVSVGWLAADVCSNTATAQGFLQDLLHGDRLHDSTGSPISADNVLAFVDDTSDEIAKAISPIIAGQMIPEFQIGATTMALRNHDLYPYFTRGVPNDQMYAEAITQLLMAHGWMHVQMVVSDTEGNYREASQTFRATAARSGICVVQTLDFADLAVTIAKMQGYPQAMPVILFGGSAEIKSFLISFGNAGGAQDFQLISGTTEWGLDESFLKSGSLRTGAQGAMTMSFDTTSSTQFARWLETMSRDEIQSNVFAADLFEMTFDCSLRQSTRAMYSRICPNPTSSSFSPYLDQAKHVIDYAFLALNTLDELIGKTCGSSYQGICPAFRALKDVSAQLHSSMMLKTTRISDGEDTSFINFAKVNGQSYNLLGQYNPSAQLLTLNDPITKQTTACSGLCVECQYLYNFKNSHMEIGDYNFVGVFSVRDPGPESLQPYICGDVRLSDGAQYSTAMFYAIDQVNKGTAPVSVKGIKIGGLALDHCGNEGLTKLLATDMYAGFLNPRGFFQETVMSWLTDTSSNTNEAMEILDPLEVAVVSPSATSANLRQYDNFFATLQSDAVVSTAIVRLAKQLGFRYLQLVYADNDFGRDSKVILTQVAQAEGLCVSESHALGQSTDLDELVRDLNSAATHAVVLYTEPPDALRVMTAIVNNVEGARQKLVLLLPNMEVIPPIGPSGQTLAHAPMSIKLRTFDVPGYDEYLAGNPMDNPFFAQYYMALYSCNVEGYSKYNRNCVKPYDNVIVNPNFQKSIFELTTINAVYASVDALDRTLKEYCGQNYTQPCALFLQAPDKRQRFNRNLNRVTFIDEGRNVFRFIEREGNVAYTLSQYDTASRSYKAQGTYAGVALNLQPDVVQSYSDVRSTCPFPCTQCGSGLKFSLTEGDIYLGGVFDVHGQSFDPFTCSDIKTLHGYLLLEAFHYALEKVNSKEGQFKDILKGITLGGVGLDACSSQVRGVYLVSNVNNGQYQLARGSVTVAPERIDTYIGSYTSSASKHLAQLLQDMKTPQISYAATTTDLNDELKYPYVFRTVPSIDKQVVAMLEYLNKNNIRYVQIAYQGNNNGESGKDFFVKMAADYNVCVAQSVVFPDKNIVTRENSKTVVSQLLEIPSANTVVTFLDTDYINSVLRVIDSTAEGSNTFRFLGSTAWADNLDAINSAERHAIDSVTLQVNADDVEDFERYIENKNLANNLNNPWFEEYFQKIHNCYTSRDNMDVYRNPCPASQTSTITSINYQQDPGVVFVINAVYAAAFAIDKTLTEVCGKDYSSVCQAYRNKADRRDMILENLADVEFNDPGDKPFKFKDRQPLIGYRFHAVVEGRLGGVVYNNIGTYNSQSGTLDLKDYPLSKPWNSGCDREDACAECPSIRYRGKRYAFAPGSDTLPADAPTVVAVFDIHRQGVDSFRCGQLNMPGFQRFLSFYHSVMQPLNYLATGVRILILDTCSNPMRVDQDLYGLLQGKGLCNTGFDTPYKISLDNMAGVLVSGDLNTQAAARVLEPFGVTYLSPNAKSTSLDDKTHLARTISPISGKAKFIAQLINALDWTYVDVLHQDSASGFYPWESLTNFLADAGICHGSSISVNSDRPNTEIQAILSGLNGKKGAKVVILIGDLKFIGRILNLASNIGIADDYIWLIGTAKEITAEFVRSVTPTLGEIRILSLHRVSETDESFTDYVKSLEYDDKVDEGNNGRVPREWFEEFLQMSKDCHLASAQKPVNADKPPCNLTEDHKRVISGDMFHQDEYVMNTIAATYALLEGVSEIQGDLSTEEKREEIKSQTLDVDYNLRNPGTYRFSGSAPLLLKFNDMRFWDAGYEVKVWKVSGLGVDGPMMWTLPAELTRDNAKELRDEFNTSSSCAESVSEGYCGCVHSAPKVDALSISPPMADKPRNYYLYDDDGEKTYDWPLWAIVVGVMTAVGAAVTFILFLILLVAYPKKGGASILGYLVIVGILCIYAINIAFFLHATDAICGIRRFLMGVVYMVTFAPLLIKAIDNWRFSHVTYSNRRYGGISSWWCMLFSALFIVIIQCIIPIMWLILEHPTAMEKGEGHFFRDDHWWCEPAGDYDLSLVISFVFVAFIILITAIFSALAYDTDTNNYESRWILFGCIITAGCFMVWMIVTTNAGPQYRDPAVAIANFVNATLLLLIIPFRKAVLMCQAKGEKDDDSNEQEPYNDYQNAYPNETFQFDDYDNQYVDSKPSEF